MNTLKRLSLLFGSILCCVLLKAGPVSLERAQQNAIEFLNKDVSSKGGIRRAPVHPQSLKLAHVATTEKNQPAYYVFDRNDGGFVVVSGDDRSVPVLGYSDSGSYNPENLPEGLKDLLKNYEEQISFVSSQKESKPRRINENWDEVSPMVKTHWNQGKPYNNLCPIDPTTSLRSITGCVAVALGQLMYYYKWPEVGTGRVSYQWKGQTLSADFSKVHFLWDKMKLNYYSDTPDTDNAVATLLYHCAVAAHADFSSKATGAFYSSETLTNYFGYADQMAHLSLDQTSIDDFEATIYRELKNARPVLFAADDTETGHAMLIDGFKDGYFHINFGWSGDQDGYYQLTAILTDWYFFNTGQSVIYNIQPDREPHVEFHLYPESSYVLSADGTELVKWKGTETEIDLKADAAFNEVRRIKSHAFSSNSTATSIILPDKTEAIETNAFEDCRELESVFIPQSVTKIDARAFTQCPYLDQFVVSENSTSFESQNGLLIDLNENAVVASAAGLGGDIVVPDGITNISSYVFAERQVTSVKLPMSLTTIGEGAFMGCQLLSTLTLPAEMEMVGAKAFKDCTGFRQITVTASTPPQVKDAAFDGMDCGTVFLCVPSMSMSQYLSSPGWKEFTTVIGMVQPEAKKLVVYLKDGTMDSYMLSEKPVVRNTGMDLVISTHSSSRTYKIDKIKRMLYFEEQEDPTPIVDEPYAVYNDGTLTFYYDQLRKSRKGETFELNTGENYPDWYGHANVTKVVFDASFASARPTSTYKWFGGMSGLTAIEGMQYLNTSSVTNMAYMFYYCSALTSLDVSHFDTSNVRTMSNMFYYLYKVTSLDVSHFNTLNCTDMSSMFEKCFNMSSLDVSHFNTSKVTNMNSMFSECYPLQSLDVSHFDTSKCKDLGSMFYYCYNLSSLDVCNFNTSNCTRMNSLFSMCDGLSSIDVSNFDTSNCTNMNNMFYNCHNLSSLDVSHFDTSKCSTVDGMFKYASGLKKLRISSTMGNLDENACEDVGSWYNPCALIAPEGFNLGVDTSGDYFVWKSGYFILGDTVFAVSAESVKLKKGETEKLQLTAGNGDYSISNSNPDVVKVELDGEEVIVTAIGQGTSTITVIDNQTKQQVTINVRVTIPTTMKVEPMEIDFELPKGSSKTEYFTVYNTGDGTLTFHFEYDSMEGIFNILEEEGEYVLEAGESKKFALVCSLPEDYKYYGGGFALRINSDATNWNYHNDWINVNFRPGEPDLETEVAYAVFKDGTLTFYYDKKRNSREGTAFDLNDDGNDPAWFSVRYDITKVVFDASFADARPTTTYRWFDDVFLIKSIEGMQYLNTSKVTNMQRMFSELMHLTSLDVSHFDTSNVTNMEGMFHLCYDLTSLDVSHFNTSKVTNMSEMFSNIYWNLTNLDVSHFDTSNVTDMSNMFKESYNLISLDVSHFNTSKVTNMSGMFYSCGDLTSLDVSHFDTSNVTDMSGMFYHNDGLTYLDLSSFNTSKVTNMSEMFYSCSALTSLNLSHFDTSNVTDMSGMFSWCENLINLDMSHFNTSKVTNMSAMFCVCPKLTNIDLSHFDTSNVTDMGYMFYQCKALTSLDVSIFDMSKCEDSERMFYECSSLKKLCVSSSMENINENACRDVGWYEPCIVNAPEGFNFGVDTSGDYFTWKSGTFKLGGTVLKEKAYAWLTGDGKTLTFCYDNKWDKRDGQTYELNKEQYVTPRWCVDDFREESVISEVVFEPSFAKARPTNTSYWFVNMTNLTEIKGLDYLNTSEVTMMYMMFDGCSNLAKLDLSHFDTSKVTTMSEMFKGCKSLASIDLSSFDTSNVKTMNWLCYDCSSLKSLDLSSFDFSKATGETYAILGKCSNLTNLVIPPSMENVDEEACYQVGSWNAPCTITAPEGFNFGVDTSGDSFTWKSGTFKLGATGIAELLDFSQLPPFSHVKIFDTAGKMIKNFSIGEIPQPLDLNGLGIGVFIVKINGVTYKIVKK